MPKFDMALMEISPLKVCLLPNTHTKKGLRCRRSKLIVLKDKQMITGTVKFFNPDKGYGFIAPDGAGQDAFVHISAVERAGMTTLDKNQKVSYELETDARGKTSAVNLQPA